MYVLYIDRSLKGKWGWGLQQKGIVVMVTVLSLIIVDVCFLVPCVLSLLAG